MTGAMMFEGEGEEFIVTWVIRKGFLTNELYKALMTKDVQLLGTMFKDVRHKELLEVSYEKNIVRVKYNMGKNAELDAEKTVVYTTEEQSANVLLFRRRD